MKSKLFCVGILISVIQINASFGQQNGHTCDSAFDMNVSDTLLPYGASLDSGWVWESRSGWLKFTVPSGKGIEGFMIDMPVSHNCSTATSGGGAIVYKGASCAVKVPVDTVDLFNPMSGCYYTNAPALFNNLADGDIYYLNIGSHPFKTRWFTHIEDSFSCSRADTLTSFPFTGCNLAMADFMQIPFTGPPPFNIPVYYTLIPTSNAVTFTVEATSCVAGGWMYAYVYDNCSFSNQYAGAGLSPGSSYTFTINNAVPGVPLILMIDGGRTLGHDIFAPAPTLCTFNIINVSGILMPVRIVDFKAHYNKFQNTVHLNWKSENEQNFDRYEVERSTNGSEFNKAGTVRGANAHEYSYNDDVSLLTAHFSRLYYRLKMVDKDGSFTYSPVRVVNNNSSFTVSVYPNPVKDKLQVYVESDETKTLQVQVVAQDGKVMLTQQWNVNEGNAVKTINTSALQSGSYFIRISSLQLQEVRGLMVEKL